MFCWLTVGAGARFLNLKGSPVNSACWAQLNLEAFGKILEEIVLELTEWPGNWLKDTLPSPSVCLSISWIFSNLVFLAKSKW